MRVLTRWVSLFAAAAAMTALVALAGGARPAWAAAPRARPQAAPITSVLPSAAPAVHAAPALSAVPVPPDSALAAAVAEYQHGYWEAAVRQLDSLLAAGVLSRHQRSRARAVLAEAHIALHQDEQAVAAYREILKDDHSFGMEDLGPRPHARVLACFAQALLEVREEEMRQQTEHLRHTSRLLAGLRSAVLPGWGQRYQGYRARSWVMLTGCAAGGIWAVAEHFRYTDRRDAYNSAGAGADFPRLYRRYQHAADRADAALGLAAGLWAVNVVDALLSGPNLDTGRRRTVQVDPAAGHGVHLAYVYSF